MERALREKTKKERDSNLELYRILVMLLIIAHHYVVNSGITKEMYEHPNAIRTLFLYLFGAWGKTGINCFVLITGYFMCKSQVTFKRVAKLLLELQFYKLVIYSLFWLTGYDRFTVEKFVKMLLPITAATTNFGGCYILFLLFIPFINVLIDHISEREHFLLMSLCLLVYTVGGTASWFSVTMNYIMWFSVLYLVASYIRMYPKKLFENNRFWGGAMAVSVLLSVISIMLRADMGAVSKVYYFVSDSNKILAFTNGLTSFMFFKTLNIRYNKWINMFSATTFGVLLIHANSDTMRQWLWRDVLNNLGMYSSPWLVVHAILSVCGIFLVCSAIDLLRIRFIEKPFFCLWDKHWNQFASWYGAVENKIMNMLQIEE